MKLPGVISLRNDLPTWAMPNGGLRRAKVRTVLKSRKMPCAVSGRRKTRWPPLLDGADRRLEHEVELARLGELALLGLARELGRALAAADLGLGVRILAASSRWSARKRRLQVLQSTSGSVKPARWPRGLPRLGVLDDRRVQRDDVVALLQHRVPPGVDDVALEQHAVVPVVVGVGDAAVDLRGGEDQAAALAQRHDLVHRHDVLGASRGTLSSAPGEAVPAGTPILRVPCRSTSTAARRAHLRGHAEDDRRPADRVTRDAASGRARLPPRRRPLQGQGLLQHRLRHQAPQPRAARVRRVRRRQVRGRAGREEEGQGEGRRRPPRTRPHPSAPAKPKARARSRRPKSSATRSSTKKAASLSPSQEALRRRGCFSASETCRPAPPSGRGLARRRA